MDLNIDNIIKNLYKAKFTKGRFPYMYFEDDVFSGRIYLSVNILEGKQLVDSDGVLHKIVIFSKSHKISEKMLKKIIIAYGVKSIQYLTNGVADTDNEIQIDTFVEKMPSDSYEKTKRNIDMYASYNARRLIFLLKRTNKKKYYDALKNEMFIVPCTVSGSKLEPLILQQEISMLNSKTGEKTVKKKMLLFGFTDTYAYKNFEVNYKDEMREYKPILLGFDELKKCIKGIGLSGMYINNKDIMSVFGKSMTYVLKIS